MQKSLDNNQKSSAHSNLKNCDVDGGKRFGVVASETSIVAHELRSGSVIFDKEAADKLGSFHPAHLQGNSYTDIISAQGAEQSRTLNQNGSNNFFNQYEEDSQSEKVIDNGIMYMKGDKIVYYNQGSERSDEEFMSDTQPHQSYKKHQNKRNIVTRDSVLSQYLADGSLNPIEGFDFSKIFDDEVEHDKFQKSSMADQVMILYQYCCDFKNRADFLEKQKVQNLDCVDSLEKELENLKMDNGNLVQQLQEMKSYIQQRDQIMDMQKEQLKLQQEVLLRHNINPESLISCDTPRKRNTPDIQQKLSGATDDTQQMTSPHEMSANATKLTVGSLLDFQSGDDYIQLRNRHIEQFGKDDIGNNNEVLNGLQDMKNQLNKLMAQKDNSSELMELRRENQIQEHRLNQRSEELHIYKFKVNALSDQINKLEKDIAFYKEKYELEKDSKNTISQKVKELKVRLRQLTSQKADLQKMNRTQQKQIEHDEKIQHLYEKLLEKAEAQGFKFKSGSTREQLNKGQSENEACKSEQQKLAQQIDIYKDEVHEGAEGEYQNSKSRNHKQMQEKNFSEISHAYDEIQSINQESKNMKKYLNKRMPEGAELDSVIEIEELQEVLKNEDNSVVADGDNLVPKCKTFVGDADENQNEEVFIKSPKRDKNLERVRGSLLVRNENMLTMAQLIKSDKLFSQQQFQQQTLIKKQETEVPKTNYSQDFLDSSKVIKEEATDEINNESNFILTGTNLDYSGDAISQPQDLCSAVNLKQELAVRNITSGQINFGLLKEMKEIQKNNMYDTGNFVSEDQSMSTRNDNQIGDQSVIESIRFYDPSDCSSALKPSETGLPQNPSRRRTHQIQFLSQDNKKLKNQIQDLKKQIETLYQSHNLQQQNVSQNKNVGIDEDVKQQLKAMHENIRCIMNQQSQYQHQSIQDNHVIKQQNVNPNTYLNQPSSQNNANKNDLFIAKNDDDKELSKIDIKNQTQIYFETNDVSIENPIENSTNIDNNNCEITKTVQNHAPNQQVDSNKLKNQNIMTQFDAGNLLQSMKLRDNHILFSGQRPSKQQNQESLFTQSHFENSANGNIEIDSPHFKNNNGLNSKLNTVKNSTNSIQRVQETMQQALFTKSQERKDSSSSLSANDHTTITKVNNDPNVRLGSQLLNTKHQQLNIYNNNLDNGQHQNISDFGQNNNNAVGNLDLKILKNQLEKARGSGLGYSQSQMQQVTGSSGCQSQPVSGRGLSKVRVDNVDQLNKIHQTFHSKADSDSQILTSNRSQFSRPTKLPQSLTSPSNNNLQRRKVTQMSIQNIFGLTNPNKIITRNIFGIPSDGQEGLAMKQRYRALHQNFNHIKNVQAPSKHDNNSSVGEGTSSQTGPSITDTNHQDRDTMMAKIDATKPSSLPASHSSLPQKSDLRLSSQLKANTNRLGVIGPFFPNLYTSMNKYQTIHK